MRDNQAFFGGYHDSQDAYFDDQASVGSANGRQARLFSSRMLTANVAPPIGPPTSAEPHPRLDSNWTGLANPAIGPRAKNPSTDDYVQLANYQDICRYAEAAADTIQDVFNACNPDDETGGLMEQANSHLATVDKISKNGIDDKSAKWEHGAQESQNVLAFLHRNDKSQGVRDKPGRYSLLAQDLEVYLQKKQFTAHQAALDKPTIQNASRRAERPKLARKRHGPGLSLIQKEIGLQDVQTEPQEPLLACQQRVQLLSAVQPAHDLLHDEPTHLNTDRHTSADSAIGSDAKIYNSEITRTWNDGFRV